MKVSDFDFNLPEQLIALRPVEPRESAKLLVVDSLGNVEHHLVGDLLHFLKNGDILVVNDTRVLPVQLTGYRYRTNNNNASSVKIEATLIKSVSENQWQAFIKPGRRIAKEDTLTFLNDHQNSPKLQAKVIDKNVDGIVLLEFLTLKETFFSNLEKIGSLPLPPYIRSKRPSDDQDQKDYQTTYAQNDGSVAAPTAGLHLTNTLLMALCQKGVTLMRLTLHVGAGTFLPVKAEEIKDHKMHAEWGQVTPQIAKQLNEARALGQRIIAVGTTSLRLLETACDDKGYFRAFSGETDIFITPGRQIHSADILMTNFHLPKSTLFMLVSAFSGQAVMKSAYEQAIEKTYRFFSYGDACFLFNRSRS